MVSIQCMENSSAKSSASVLVVMTTAAVQGLLFTMSAAGSRFKANSLNLTKVVYPCTVRIHAKCYHRQVFL